MHAIIGAVGAVLVAIFLSTAESQRPLFHRYILLFLANMPPLSQLLSSFMSGVRRAGYSVYGAVFSALHISAWNWEFSVDNCSKFMEDFALVGTGGAVISTYAREYTSSRSCG